MQSERPRSGRRMWFERPIIQTECSTNPAIEMHSRCIPGTFWQYLKWLAVSILPRMRSECSQNAVRIFLYFECTSKVLSMSKIFGPATRIGPNVWNAVRIFRMHFKCTSNIQVYTKNFHFDGIPAHSASSVTGV